MFRLVRRFSAVAALACLSVACNDASRDAEEELGQDTSVSLDAIADVVEPSDVGEELGDSTETVDASDPDVEDTVGQLDSEDTAPGVCDLSYVCRRLPALEALPMPILIEAIGNSAGVVCGVAVDGSTQLEEGVHQWERSLDSGDTWQPMNVESDLATIRIGGWSAPPYGEQQYRITDTDCPESPIVVDLTLPGASSASIGMSLSWFTRGGTPTADLDLFLLRHPDECWGDERHTVRRGFMWQFLDWGQPGPGDEPNEGSNDVRGDGEEWLLAGGRSSEEPWTVAGLIYSVPEGGTVVARMQVIEGGEGIIDVTREFDAPVFWIVARAQADGWNLVDETEDATTFLECDIASRCPDGSGAAEICDGIDNDCDGEIDESPDACYNEGRGREFCSRVVIDDVEVTHVCRDPEEADQLP